MSNTVPFHKTIPFLITAISLISFLPGAAQVVHQIDFDRFTHYDMDDWITYAPATHITSIDISEEFVYIGTQSGGILRYNFYDREWHYPFTMSSGLSSNRILDVVYSYGDGGFKAGVLYARTDKGIDMYDPGFNGWRPTYSDRMPQRREPAAEEVEAYRQAPDYNFPVFYRPYNSELPDFFMKDNNIFRQPDMIIDGENRKFRINGARIVDVLKRLWMGTDGLGVVSTDLNSRTLALHNRSISNIRPRAVYYDTLETLLWIGGQSRKMIPSGIDIWDYKTDTWKTYESRFFPGMYSHDVNAITGSTEFIFFGTEYGLVKYTKKTNAWKTYTRGEQLESDLVYDLKWLGGKLFIATDAGFNWMEPGYHFISRPKDADLRNTPVFRMASKDSILYLAAKTGIYKFIPQTNDLSFFQTGSAVLDVQISAMNINKTGEIWIAGRYGIMYYFPVEDRWESFPNISRYISGKINDIQFTAGNVWFATDDGLLKYGREMNRWYLYTTGDGLSSDRVYRIQEDGNDLLLCTDGGLTIFRWKRKGRIE